MLVNPVGVTVTDARSKTTYSRAFVTLLPFTPDTPPSVSEAAAITRRSDTDLNLVGIREQW